MFAEAIERFWKREHKEDVALLNRELGKRGQSAGFVDSAPPSVLTGDPFRLEPDQCILVLGLNPKWQGDDAAFLQNDVQPAVGAWKAKDFQSYRQFRASYFAASSKAYYGAYFSRLGNTLGQALLSAGTAKSKPSVVAREVFTRHAAKFDLLPWWSSGTSAINVENVRSTIEPVAAWQGVLHAFIQDFRPTEIIVNGSGLRSVVTELLRCRLQPLDRHGAYQGRVGELDRQNDGAPVLVHAQLNSPGGLGHDQYRELVAAWRTTRGE
jgi:hypothetical protein